jgi:iron-sulfur cluster repair protein YtfE (RIC family)
MKRHPSLVPLSRDHNVGLILARKLSRGDQGVADEFLAAWNEEMSDHFDEEERLLQPLMDPGHRQRLQDEHREIRALVAQLQAGDDVAEELGTRLHDHIRWEERQLFPAIEACATPTQLDALAKQTAELEHRRAHSTVAPRRGQL